MEILIDYIIMCSPALASVIGIIISIITCLKKLTLVKDEAQNAFNTIKNSQEIKDLKDLCKKVIDENDMLKKALIETTEALTRIRNRHPELFKDGE